jgi:MFS family permease
MKNPWSKTVLPIAVLFSFRMLGLFMLIPIFTPYARQLHAATPALIGIALGSYGLSQGLLQIPFGLFSDRWGRKKMISFGLILFACGSFIGAWSTSIYGMIFARTLQGMGAIGSVLIALLADLTPDNERTKAMAVIGISIGLSFSLAMVISPSIAYHFGLQGIFYLTAGLAFAGLILLHTVIPSPLKEPLQPKTKLNLHLFKKAIASRHLQRLNFGIFCQHFILVATFYCVPMLLEHYTNDGVLTEQWHFYLPLMLASFVLMLPFLIVGEKKKKMKPVFLISILLTGLCQLILAFSAAHWISFCALLFFYFLAFNILEASLPSFVSRQAPNESKGTTMGIYSSCQFLGIFAGGAVSGLIYQYGSYQAIFLCNAVLSVLWLILSCYLQPYAYQVSLSLPYEGQESHLPHVLKALRALPGVDEAIAAPKECLFYLRINKAIYQDGSAEKVLRG